MASIDKIEIQGSPYEIIAASAKDYTSNGSIKTALDGKVPTGRKVNGKALSADITLNAANVSAISTTARGAANGVASLDANGKVPTGQLPAMQSLTAGTDLKITNSIISVNTNGTVGNSAQMSFVAGSGSYASGYGAAAFGISTSAIGAASHAEGGHTSALGDGSHAEGGWTSAWGDHAHAEGAATLASGNDSHAECYCTLASGDYSHAEGGSTSAVGKYSHAEGYYTLASDGNNTTYTGHEHAEGDHTSAFGRAAHAEGAYTIASSNGAQGHAEGWMTSALTDHGHTEGETTLTSGNGHNAHAEGKNTRAFGFASHAEGELNSAMSNYSHAEGNSALASGVAAHAEGSDTSAVGFCSHAEGEYTIASGENSHAEGAGTRAVGNYSHAEGYSALANGVAAHAEGSGTSAIGSATHAGGFNTMVSGDSTFAHGDNNTANGKKSFVIGVQNKIGTTNFRDNVSSNYLIGERNYIDGVGANYTAFNYQNYLLGETNVVGTNSAVRNFVFGGGNSLYTDTTESIKGGYILGHGNKIHGGGPAYDYNINSKDNVIVGIVNSAIGIQNGFVGGSGSLIEALEVDTTAIGGGDDVLAYSARAYNMPSFAYGLNVSAKGGAIAMGIGSFATIEQNKWSITDARHGYDTSYGTEWYGANDDQHQPVGYNGGGVAIGSFVSAYNAGSFACGLSGLALAPASFVAGKGNTAVHYGQAVIGKYADANTVYSNRKAIFAVGDGTKNNTSNAFVVYEGGYIGNSHNNTINLIGSFSAAAISSNGKNYLGANTLFGFTNHTGGGTYNLLWTNVSDSASRHLWYTSSAFKINANSGMITTPIVSSHIINVHDSDYWMASPNPNLSDYVQSGIKNFYLCYNGTGTATIAWTALASGVTYHFTRLRTTAAFYLKITGKPTESWTGLYRGGAVTNNSSEISTTLANSTDWTGRHVDFMIYPSQKVFTLDWY